MNKILYIMFVFSTLLWSNSVTILSAGNMKFVFEDIVEAYHKIYPDDVIDVEFDSSGKIANDIIAGKSYDIFLSADMGYPQKIYDLGLSATQPELYTTGGLILLIATHPRLKKDGLNILLDPNLKAITIANNKSAPYGMAAIETLKNLQIYDKVEKKLFYSIDASSVIGDVLWYGHAGILPKSAIASLPRGYNIKNENYIEVDKSLYSPIKQGFVYSKAGIKNKAALRFIEFLLSDDCKKILQRNGYN